MNTQTKINALEEKVKYLEERLDINNSYAPTSSKISNHVSPEFDSPNLDARKFDEIDIQEIISAIWKGKWIIIVATLLFGIGSIYYSLSLPDIYKSEALLISNSGDQGSNGLGSIVGQFGGLASLAGVSLGNGNVDKTDFALEVLQSREFLYSFIDENNLRVLLMAANGWDRETNQLLFDDKIYEPNSNSWTRVVSKPFSSEPSLHEAYTVFIENHLVVSQDEDNGLVTISVSHYSPFVAKDIVDKLITNINESIKQQDMTEASTGIEYLKEEIDTTNNAGAQKMFYELIEQQYQKLMLTKVREDYVLKVVDSAIVSEQKYKPKRAIICIFGVFVGCILSVFLVLIRHYLVKNRNTRKINS